MARRLRLSRLAQADIEAVLQWSEHEFGSSTRDRYAALITAALTDLIFDPLRTGARRRTELGAGVLSYHLHFSRNHVRGGIGKVRRPRHLLIYRLESDDIIAVSRLLQDMMELPRYLPPADTGCSDD